MVVCSCDDVMIGAVNILDRIGHNAVVHLSEAAVRFSVLNENVDGVHVYSELIQVRGACVYAVVLWMRDVLIALAELVELKSRTSCSRTTGSSRRAAIASSFRSA